MNNEMWFGSDGFDFAQICLNGHLINSASTIHPKLNQKHCHKCGASTITACPDCNGYIKGTQKRVAQALSSGDDTLPVPAFCMDCGAPFPWTKEKLGIARELISDIKELNNEEKENFYRSIEDITKESPRTKLAAIKVKGYLAKAGNVVGGAIRDIVVDIASETAKKMIGL